MAIPRTQTCLPISFTSHNRLCLCPNIIHKNSYKNSQNSIQKKNYQKVALTIPNNNISKRTEKKKRKILLAQQQ